MLNEPSRTDYFTEDEYEEALGAYWDAVQEKEDRLVARRIERNL